MPKKNSIPDRWLQYQAIGNKIGESRFVAMKVPLKKQISVPKEDKFSCDDVFQHFDKQNEDLGLIIDLTYTSRYYNPESFTTHGVDHCKILMPGHELPSDRIVETFKQKVLSFEEENLTNNKLIAVHCTHGVNRTGYLICRYLIEEKGMDANHAISAFEHARGHGIERPVYLNSLRGLKTTSKTSPKPDKSYYQGPIRTSTNSLPQSLNHPSRQHPRFNTARYPNGHPSGHNNYPYYHQRNFHTGRYGQDFSRNWRCKRYEGHPRMHGPQSMNEGYRYYDQKRFQRPTYFHQQNPRYSSGPYQWNRYHHPKEDEYY
uniref:RNA/RNP complex-1-interacting phosphatase n=1 Tax=Phallusia mammillata TaxID=59560 RepID=A0A6F9DBA9_9ASCI|nr:RNA/RNP complex-1-interacting phosphatase [Phallusia mammillata]